MENATVEIDLVLREGEGREFAHEMWSDRLRVKELPMRELFGNVPMGDAALRDIRKDIMTPGASHRVEFADGTARKEMWAD